MIISLQCQVCRRPARSRNYGIIACDACKMFFRRSMLEKLKFSCKKQEQCFESRSTLTYFNRKCKSCRLAQCLRLGMTLGFSHVDISIRDAKNVRFSELIHGLMYRDASRENGFLTSFLFANPDMKAIIENADEEGKKLSMVARNPNDEMTYIAWIFINCVTVVKFLLNLGFMKHLEAQDKLILLRHFYLRATIMIFAFHAMQNKKQGLTTPDGQDVFPDDLLFIPTFTPHRLWRLRAQTVERFAELKVTKEEFVLLLVIFFANPALSSLSKSGVEVLATQHKLYSSALFQYCQLRYQSHAPTRFTDLLSLCHVVNRNFNDLEFMITMFRVFRPDAQVQKLVCNEA